MRKISVNTIANAVRELCIEANVNLRDDIRTALKKALKKETGKKSKRVLGILLENAEIARIEKRAICQDTGFVSVFLRIGQDVRLVGGDLNKAVEKGVREGYARAYLRKSVVRSPIVRVNTGTNTPASIYSEIVKGSRLEITVVPKGFGSENKSAIKMLSPTDGEKEITQFVIEVVKRAGADACPPYVLGIGIGGTFEKCAGLAKLALTIPLGKASPKKYLRKLENTILKEVNRLRIGAMGLGGRVTCLAVKALEYPTHIAGLPVAVNVGCHATRSARKVI